jgi:hypothetical protein
MFHLARYGPGLVCAVPQCLCVKVFHWQVRSLYENARSKHSFQHFSRLLIELLPDPKHQDLQSYEASHLRG